MDFNVREAGRHLVALRHRMLLREPINCSCPTLLLYLPIVLISDAACLAAEFSSIDQARNRGGLLAGRRLAAASC
jgi:hypothetical protein